MKTAQSSWSFTLITLRGVPIRVHASFFLLLAWIALGSKTTDELLSNSLFTVAVFACVTLHECGHVFTAKIFGIQTRDITLYPFGGVAMVLQNAKPFGEILIALAGPLVNVLIAGALFPFAEVQTVFPVHEPLTFIGELYKTNIILAVFNLMPALPMDGGRVLRATLALFNIQTATKIAGRISQAFSIAMGLAGLFSQSPMLVIIGILVFNGAVQEMVHAKAKTIVTGRTIEPLIWEVGKLYCFQHGTTLSNAVRDALRSNQDVFPVLLQDSLLGLVYRDQLIDALADPQNERYISELVDREVFTLPSDTPLDKAMDIVNEKHVDVIPIVDNGKFLGLFYPHHVSDLLLVDSLKQHSQKMAEQDLDDF